MRKYVLTTSWRGPGKRVSGARRYETAVDSQNGDEYHIGTIVRCDSALTEYTGIGEL